MIHRVNGDIDFASGLHIRPHCSVQILNLGAERSGPVRTQRLSLQGWKRHVLGTHVSEHGNFEVEALSAEDDCVHLVLLCHQHPFYEAGTPEDAERRAFHDGVISSDLGGQREFSWGEVVQRLERPANKVWLVVAYHRESKVPLPVKGVLLRLFAHESFPSEKT